MGGFHRKANPITAFFASVKSSNGSRSSSKPSGCRCSPSRWRPCPGRTRRCRARRVGTRAGGAPVITKDGVSVAKEIELADKAW